MNLPLGPETNSADCTTTTLSHTSNLLVPLPESAGNLKSLSDSDFRAARSRAPPSPGLGCPPWAVFQCPTRRPAAC
eukprot:1613936-Rhodomonas_salina.1